MLRRGGKESSPIIFRKGGKKKHPAKWLSEDYCGKKRSGERKKKEKEKGLPLQITLKEKAGKKKGRMLPIKKNSGGGEGKEKRKRMCHLILIVNEEGILLTFLFRGIKIAGGKRGGGRIKQKIGRLPVSPRVVREGGEDIFSQLSWEGGKPTISPPKRKRKNQPPCLFKEEGGGGGNSGGSGQ